MSNPNGKIERKILDCLESLGWPTAHDLARSVYGSDVPTTAQLVSVRRALRALEHKGLIYRALRGRGRMSGRWHMKQRKRRGRQRRQEDSAAGVFEVPPKPQTKDREKLAMILGMLGSEHDGEVLNAARQAEKLRKQINKTWEHLLCGPDESLTDIFDDE